MTRNEWCDLEARRSTYWQAIREKCADIRDAPSAVINAKYRTLVHYYQQWRGAYDVLKKQEKSENERLGNDQR